MRVLRDPDLDELLPPERAIAWMRDALRDHSDGRLTAPPRVETRLGGSRLVFTTGRLDDEWYGYRSYDTLPTESDAQVVVVHDVTTGDVLGIAIGRELGPRRVGAIGGVAADLLARPDATRVGLVGSGVQARHQLAALATVRPLDDVRVFSRILTNRTAFAEWAERSLGLPCRPVATARDAVEGADIVVLATSSPLPVVERSWIEQGAYVTTLGPKQVGAAEFGPDLVDGADVVVTDSLDQIGAYHPPNILAGTPQGDRLVNLGDVVTGRAAGRGSPEQTVLFCSVGLAGTEVYLLARLLGR